MPNREWEMKRSAAEGISEQWEDRGGAERETAVGSLLRKEKKNSFLLFPQCDFTTRRFNTHCVTELGQ